MRPNRRMLAAGLAALALTVLAVAISAIPVEAAIAVWAMLAALLLLDALLSPGRRSVAVSLDGPAEVFSGEDATFTALLESGRALPRRIAARLALPDGVAGPPEFSLDTAAGTARGTLHLSARRRGTYPLGDLWLSWPSRLGLLEITPRFRVPSELRVVPNIRPVASGQIDVAIRSELYGVKENLMRGEGSEFHQLREFTTGMDTRAIDWKRSARRRDLVAKETRAERNHQVILCLDNGYLMRQEIAGLPKIDHAVNAALALAWAAGVGGDLVGLISYDAQPGTFLPPEPGRAAFPRLRSHVAGLDYRSVESNHTLALTRLGGLLKRRSLIVVFSDFVDTTTAELLVENIHVLARHHVIIFCAQRDPELEVTARATGQSLTRVAEAVAAAQLIRERQIVLDRLSRMGVLVIDTPPGGLTAGLVSTYLTVKSRELI